MSHLEDCDSLNVCLPVQNDSTTAVRTRTPTTDPMTSPCTQEKNIWSVVLTDVLQASNSQALLVRLIEKPADALDTQTDRKTAGQIERYSPHPLCI